ncbi:unnamed protein product [Adineta ricciae]|uniref:Uncharacterized protein n=1 Tax=Adineta ricciae TaxID=249248 RepID=A0A814TRX2_ADIRI|nr:unnamed protein product [Adineta ricciae]
MKDRTKMISLPTEESCPSDEKKLLLTSGTSVIYHSPLSIPYSDIIHDDRILVASSNVVEDDTSDSLLFNGTMPDRTCPTQKFNVLLVDDNNNNTSSIVLPTTCTNGDRFSERLFSIKNVSTSDFSDKTSMFSSKSKTTSLSSLAIKARPFDEFLAGVTFIPALGPIEEHNPATKSDKD